ncbi:hypothetical protein [Winogradskyella sediminis]|uniref:hypothetical protein n=1 Tax=Winogradskyella sediminis TaxID=1382466 RepID=UPI000E23829E|nr:hypothetical protein [Winogradskyella sediminis]REG86182.1 hypothetical protein C8N41_103280 [Winogradskyella sediminis]
MPKQNGLFKLKGTLQGKCYYQLNGQYIVRKAVGPSRERINTDPAFSNVKSNNQEFAAASKLSKALRQGLGDNAIRFKDSYMTGRLTGCCRKIIQKGSGLVGQREANLHNHPTALIGFQLKKELPLEQIYTAKPQININNTRHKIDINIPKSNSNHHNQKPINATHFQLTAALSLVSNLQWESNENAYQPTHSELHTLSITNQTQPLLCKIEHTHIHMPLHMPTTVELPNTIAITVWLGITYLKIDDGNYVTYQSPKAMACIAVL